MEQKAHEKEIMIAKMNHKTAMLTAVIGAVVSLVGVFIPIIISNTNKAEAQNTSETMQATVTPTATITKTPTPTLTREDLKKLEEELKKLEEVQKKLEEQSKKGRDDD